MRLSMKNKKPIQSSIVAGVVIEKNDKYLLVQENRPGTRVHGLWNFPAGRVDKGYAIEETAVKEAYEEVGYKVELIRKIGIFQAHTNTPPKHAFEAKIISGKLKWPKNEIQNAKWFTLEEIKKMQNKLREDWILGAISLLLKNGKRPKVGLGVYILNSKNELLLLKRIGSYGPGTWCPPGGHLEFGESFAEGGKRETKEETGLIVDDIRVVSVTNDIYKKEQEHYITIALSAKLKSGKAKIMEPDKCTDIGWFKLNKLPENLFLPNKNFFKSNVDCLCGSGKKFKECHGR